MLQLLLISFLLLRYSESCLPNGNSCGCASCPCGSFSFPEKAVAPPPYYGNTGGYVKSEDYSGNGYGGNDYYYGGGRPHEGYHSYAVPPMKSIHEGIVMGGAPPMMPDSLPVSMPSLPSMPFSVDSLPTQLEKATVNAAEVRMPRIEDRLPPPPPSPFSSLSRPAPAPAFTPQKELDRGNEEYKERPSIAVTSEKQVMVEEEPAKGISLKKIEQDQVLPDKPPPYITYYNQECTGEVVGMASKETVASATEKCSALNCQAANARSIGEGLYEVIYLRDVTFRSNKRGIYCLSSQKVPLKKVRAPRDKYGSSPAFKITKLRKGSNISNIMDSSDAPESETPSKSRKGSEESSSSEEDRSEHRRRSSTSSEENRFFSRHKKRLSARELQSQADEKLALAIERLDQAVEKDRQAKERLEKQNTVLSTVLTTPSSQTTSSSAVTHEGAASQTTLMPEKTTTKFEWPKTLPAAFFFDDGNDKFRLL